jgi:hypothetical protein
MSQRGLTGRSSAMSVTRIFLRRSACFRSLCGAIFVLCDTSPLSADDDALRIKSKSPARGLGLSLESLPNKQVSPVQTSVDDSLTGIALSWRVVPCGETAGDSLRGYEARLRRDDVHADAVAGKPPQHASRGTSLGPCRSWREKLVGVLPVLRRQNSPAKYRQRESNLGFQSTFPLARSNINMLEALR